MVYASTLRHVSMGLHKSDKCTTFLRSHHRRTASTSSCTAFLALLGYKWTRGHSAPAAEGPRGAGAPWERHLPSRPSKAAPRVFAGADDDTCEPAPKSRRSERESLRSPGGADMRPPKPDWAVR